MDTLNNYSFKHYNLTVWFFRLILLMFSSIILLVFLLKINETITISEGQIVSANPQVDYKAPFDAHLVKVYVKEGQSVKQGDTLLVVRNPEKIEQYSKTKAEIEYIKNKIKSIDVLKQAVANKRSAIDQTSIIAARKYQLDINRLVTDMKTLDQQYNFSKRKTNVRQRKIPGRFDTFLKRIC